MKVVLKETTNESFIYYYLYYLTLDCAVIPTFDLFCHIFLLSRAVLFSHPLALSKRVVPFSEVLSDMQVAI